MAEAVAASKRGDKSLLQNISQQLTCSICLEHYRIPKTVTPCLHTFCQGCLQEIIDSTATRNGTKGTFPCPKCRGEVVFDYPLVQGTAKESIAENRFKTNFDIQSHVEAIEDQIITGCPQHSGETLMFFCKTCALSACSLCLTETHLPHNHVISGIKTEAETIRKQFKCKQTLLAENIKNHSKLLLQHQSELTKLGKIKTNAEETVKVFNSGVVLTQIFIHEIEQCENNTTKTIDKMHTLKENCDRLNEIMTGADLQVVDGKKEATNIVDYLLLGYNDISPPIVLDSEDMLAEIHEKISSKLYILTDWRDDDEEDQKENEEEREEKEETLESTSRTADLGLETKTANLYISPLQKQLLGEWLFPLVTTITEEIFGTTQVPGKITGMLLELGPTTVMEMLGHHEVLTVKVEEALSVLLKVHRDKMEQNS